MTNRTGDQFPPARAPWAVCACSLSPRVGDEGRRLKTVLSRGANSQTPSGRTWRGHPQMSAAPGPAPGVQGSAARGRAQRGSGHGLR